MLLGPNSQGDLWSQGVLAGNGRIYCLPKFQTALVIDSSRWVYVGDFVLLRCLVDTEWAHLKALAGNVNTRKRKRVRESSESELLDFLFGKSPKGVFALIVCYL